MAMTRRVHGGGDAAIECVERREERGGTIAFVIMGHGLRTSFLHGQSRLGTIERLNLTLLIDGQDNRMLGWVEIEPDNINEFLFEVRIVGELEGACQVWLESMVPPDAQYRRRTQSRGFGHRAAAPLRGINRSLTRGLLEHGGDDLGSDHRCAPGPLRIALNGVDAVSKHACSPAGDGADIEVKLLTNVEIRVAVSRHQDHLRTLDDTVGDGARTGQTLEERAIFGSQ